ncbi:hypothetical protein GJ744_004873 [Endocarpon pusillum]|uniref:Uncharacterized protein n=1 Tax=Endocarpon pusillum TaxID=364733 RepID=A0A8H7ALM1_9EURO|nr:hypothetical protein GJ744_004873 [Endocarpon pusillum]
MGRSVDQDVHAAFIEFRAKDDDKCLSVQCIYCHQTRAKNTSRQKQHLAECTANPNNHVSAIRAQASPGNAVAAPNGYTTPSGPGQNALPGPAGTVVNGVPPSGPSLQTPLQTMTGRPAIPSQTAVAGPSTLTTPARPTAATTTTTTKTPKTAKSTPGTGLPAPPLDDVHASFVEFRAKDEDKCLSVQCMFCQQVRAKNTSRQRQHLQECPQYLAAMKDSIPANNLLHKFDEGEIARSLQLPTPSLELDFRMSIKLNPRVSLGPGLFGERNWVSYVGGSWAGRWGKGAVIPGGQDSQLVVKDLATRLSASYLLQTNDEPPAFICVKTWGWRTGSKDVLEKLQDPAQADSVNPNSYKFRLNIELETGDERYLFVNTLMWVGSGCRRGAEAIYDAYRIL